MADQPIMEITNVREAIAWQADHAERAFAPRTARVIRAELAILDTDTGLARRMNNWHGLSLEDAMPLRVAGGLHHLFLSGEDRRLEPVYAGLTTDQGAVDAIVAELARQYDARLMPWLDSPPQTNEAGRSASIMAGLLWLSDRLGPRFELNEIGASAGVNTMMGRYFYNLGGVKVGPGLSRMKIVPEWKGGPPPSAEVQIESIRGCDIAPVDLADPAQALRLKAYVWADATERMARLDTAIAMAETAPPELVRQDAGEFVKEMLARPQDKGVTRVLFHSVMWQYLPGATRDAITRAMEEAGAQATADKPLAWIRLETNRQTFRHELSVRYWPGGEEAVMLAEAHPHGAWVEWHGG
ncbi:hypothetical protein FHS61_002395 [Altererythrobacter atlanticus]|uniref:Uncharacterized protein n=1 Tax=Croceibacterium atlanticum TaxID=1267766 RepID=A0A0F7KSG3_9SPHN|nr:DUF2332 domain-containing protein [Croceibacterium atlanticum]AKH42071.1 hypothetical protein WYH_01023 [Croceibacterium atlanticum]MBB5733360.1 hypothetical protein [Croceibacterium atlanticum]